MWIVVWVFGLLAFVVVLVGLLLLIPVRVALSYSRLNGDDEGHVEVRYLLGLLCWRRQLHKLELKATPKGVVAAAQSSAAGHKPEDARVTQADTMSWTEVRAKLHEIPEWVSRFRRIQPVFTELLSRTVVERLACRTRIGTGEVITTGMASGVFWAIMGPIMTYLSTHVHRFVQPQLAVQSDFQSLVFEIDVDCIMKVRAGYVIAAGLRVNRLLKRRTSHGSPDSGSNADSDVEHSRNG